MPTFVMDKTYQDGNALTETDLDNMKESTETFINTTKLDSSNLQAGGIQTSNLADNAVTEAKIATSVAGNGLAGGAGSALSVNVDSSTIEISSDSLRVKDAGVTQAKLATGAVGTAQLIDANVTVGKLATINKVVGSSITFSTALTSLQLAGTTGNITVSGNRPVMILLQPVNGTTGQLYMQNNDGSADQVPVGGVSIARGATTLGVFLTTSPTLLHGGGVWDMAPGTVAFTDFPTAGTYNYSINLELSTNSRGSLLIGISNCNLIAIEY